ncbi:MAG: NAD(P)/FAD-dependent oxidoreductase [Firmicutes bacterium]|nr:NAD(P)/FAD-dependent oxidoreductase [Bacillota bacterium]
MSNKYDCIIVGTGPAGIFTAWELSQKSNLRILMLEKGRDIKRRQCPLADSHKGCLHCQPCAIVSGWGGAGAFSDGKLTLTTEFGGWLGEYVGIPELKELIEYIDKIYLQFGAPEKVHGMDAENVTRIKRRAAAADLHLIPAPVRHLGTDRTKGILSKMYQALSDRGVEVRTLTPVKSLLVEDGAVKGVELANGEQIEAPFVVCAPGREGSEWFAKEAQRLQLSSHSNPVDIGVRVEVPAAVLSHLTDIVYESKLLFYAPTFDDLVRTFCMNPQGQVVLENNDGLLTVNGHSYVDKKTDNTNFALLVSKSFTEPFREPISYGKYIASLANMLGGTVLVQRLGDLLSGRRSTPKRIARGLVRPTLPDATPGDLSLVLPYRYLTSILEMLEALDKIAPGIYSRHTLLYGVEVKFYSSRVELTSELETAISGLFAGGDGAGVTRGLAQASASGVLMARAILART